MADDATIEFRKEERVEFSHIIRSKHIGTRCLEFFTQRSPIFSRKYQVNVPKTQLLHAKKQSRLSLTHVIDEMISDEFVN